MHQAPTAGSCGIPSFLSEFCPPTALASPAFDSRRSHFRHDQPQPLRSKSSVRTFAFFGIGGSKGSSAKTGRTRCVNCGGNGSIECKGCKGTGKNKKNGNIFERWKCYDCQGFGLVSCPRCGSGGLTPEQRGER